MSDHLENYSKEPLSDEELQRHRRDSGRNEEMYRAFGPLAYAINRGRYWVLVLAVVVFLTSDWGRAIISTIAEIAP